MRGINIHNLDLWLKARGLGRNDKCWCDSGKKHKKCCINIDWSKPINTPPRVK